MSSRSGATCLSFSRRARSGLSRRTNHSTVKKTAGSPSRINHIIAAESCWSKLAITPVIANIPTRPRIAQRVLLNAREYTCGCRPHSVHCHSRQNPQRHYRDVIELISLEAPDLVRAARRVTRNAIVIAICDGPRPVRTHAFQWQTLPPRRNRYSVTIWLSGRPTLCAPMEHLSL